MNAHFAVCQINGEPALIALQKNILQPCTSVGTKAHPADPRSRVNSGFNQTTGEALCDTELTAHTISPRLPVMQIAVNTATGAEQSGSERRDVKNSNIVNASDPSAPSATKQTTTQRKSSLLRSTRSTFEAHSRRAERRRSPVAQPQISAAHTVEGRTTNAVGRQRIPMWRQRNQGNHDCNEPEPPGFHKGDVFMKTTSGAGAQSSK